VSAIKHTTLFRFFDTEYHYTAQRDDDSNTVCVDKYMCFYFNILILHKVTILNTVETVNLCTHDCRYSHSYYTVTTLHYTRLRQLYSLRRYL